MAGRRKNCGQSFHVIDFMDWLTGESNTVRGRTVFGDGGRNPTGRQTVNGRRRLQNNYETKPVEGFTDEEIDEFRQIFEFYDVDNSKTMNLLELKMAISSLGYNPEDHEIKHMAKMMDVDGDQTVDFSEFCMIIEYMKQQKAGYGELRDSFRCIDPLGDGKVDSENLIELLALQPDGMKVNQINELVKFAENGNDGTIDYEEFIARLKEEDEKLAEVACSKSLDEISLSGRRSPCSEQKFKLDGKEDTPERKKRLEKKKKKNEEEKARISNSKRNVEEVDTLIKALGGPILLTSAVIITSSLSKSSPKKKSHWPSIRRLLKFKLKEEEKEKLEANEAPPCDEERISLLDAKAVEKNIEGSQDKN